MNRMPKSPSFRNTSGRQFRLADPSVAILQRYQASERRLDEALSQEGKLKDKARADLKAAEEESKQTYRELRDFIASFGDPENGQPGRAIIAGGQLLCLACAETYDHETNTTSWSLEGAEIVSIDMAQIPIFGDTPPAVLGIVERGEQDTPDGSSLLNATLGRVDSLERTANAVLARLSMLESPGGFAHPDEDDAPGSVADVDVDEDDDEPAPRGTPVRDDAEELPPTSSGAYATPVPEGTLRRFRPIITTSAGYEVAREVRSGITVRDIVDDMLEEFEDGRQVDDLALWREHESGGIELVAVIKFSEGRGKPVIFGT